MQQLYAYIFENASTRQLKTDLGKTILFKDLIPRELEIIVQKTNIRAYRAGDHVFFQGDPGAALYVILRGNIEIERQDGSKKTTLAHLTSGMFFGELAIVYEGIRTATAHVTEDATLFCLFKHDLDRLLKQHPRLANKLLLNLSRILAERLRSTNEKLSRR